MTEDGRWLVVTVWRGSGPPNIVKALDLTRPDAGFVDVVPEWTDEYDYVGSSGDRLFFMTDNEAPRKRLVSVDLGDPSQPVWNEVIPEQEATLKSVHVGGELIANMMQDATTRLVRWSEDGDRTGHRAARPGHGLGQRRSSRAPRHVLFVLELHHSADRVSIRSRPGDIDPDRRFPDRRRSVRVHGGAGLLRKQGRHAGADVPGATRRHAPGRKQPDPAVRIRDSIFH